MFPKAPLVRQITPKWAFLDPIENLALTDLLRFFLLIQAFVQNYESTFYNINQTCIRNVILLTFQYVDRIFEN